MERTVIETRMKYSVLAILDLHATAVLRNEKSNIIEATKSNIEIKPLVKSFCPVLFDVEFVRLIETFDDAVCVFSI